MVELDRKYNPGNSGTQLDEDFLKSLPLPLFDAYRLLEKESDFEKSLHILCLSLIPWTCQYIALILSGEYLSSEDEPSVEVTDNLLNMVKKPGPGKWMGFTRSAALYFMGHKTRVIPKEAIAKLDRLLNSKELPMAKIPGNENKLEYSDALINIRNRFAHSRLISVDKAKELFLDYFLIWKAWIMLIRDICEPRLLYRTSPAGQFQPFDNRPFEPDTRDSYPDSGTIILWNKKQGEHIKLYPVIVTYSEDSAKNAGVAFLEEIKSRYLFYLQGENFFRLKDEFVILSKMIESKTIAENVVSAQDLTLQTFSERIDRITNQTITGFTDALKYIPEMYVDRPSVSEKLDKWIDSEFAGCILTGNPGTGKTSIVASWCTQRKEKGDHVLLMEASSLKESDITSIIEKDLNLGSPLKDCLDAIQKQNVSSGIDANAKRFIIVVDAINEFTGKENESRGRLWREINSLVSILNLYRPYLKCLVTTRSDLWSVDFPGRNSAYDLLKDKLYWSDSNDGFPRIILGDLFTDEAGMIFEKARKTIPSMAVLTSFDELTEKTREVLCNPFLLRLALVTYNERKMPALTRSSIERRYAKERITEEKDKTTVLFALLERMSELRKTEVTFDEFLYGQTSKSMFKPKMSDKDRKNLEKLIFDPRPGSPYKQLLKEGILEEKSDSADIQSREKIRFSQEKIVDIIYPEFQARSFRIMKMPLILVGICLLLMVAAGYFDVKGTIADNFKLVQIGLGKSACEPGVTARVSQLSADWIKRAFLVDRLESGSITFFALLVMAVSTVLLVSLRFLIARMAKVDLPTKYITEKFNVLQQQINRKRMFYLMAILFVLMFGWMKLAYKSVPDYVFYSVMLVILIFWNLIIGIRVVLKNANTPQDAFCLFGKSDLLYQSLGFMIIIPFLLLLNAGVSYIGKSINLESDKKFQHIKQEWVSDNAVKTLQNGNPEIYSEINNKLMEIEKKVIKSNIINKKSESAYFFIGKAIFYASCIVYPVYIVIRYLMGFWLFRILQRRMYGASGG